MAKVLDELPGGLPLNRARQGSGAVGGTSTKAPSGPSKPKTAPKAGRASDKAPKALRRAQGTSGSPLTVNRVHRAFRDGGFINSQEGHEMLMRRCEAFGIMSSRYFKGRHTAGTGKTE